MSINENRASLLIDEDLPLEFNQIRSSCGRYIYHISIIDYLQKYDLNKKLERAGKIVLMNLPATKAKKQVRTEYNVFDDETKFRHDDLSVISPDKYRDRFLDFCKKQVFSNV